MLAGGVFAASALSASRDSSMVPGSNKEGVHEAGGRLQPLVGLTVDVRNEVVEPSK